MLCFVCCTSRGHSGCCQVSCLLLWAPLNKANGPYAFGFLWQTGIKAHKSHSSCSQRGVTIQIRLWCSSSLPPFFHSLALGGMCGQRGGGVLCSSGLSLSPCLFGEFADDTDQCSIFIFKTLVVCSQVHQNLAVIKSKWSNSDFFLARCHITGSFSLDIDWFINTKWIKEELKVKKLTMGPIK